MMLIALFTVLSQNVSAANVVTIGTGTLGYNIPFNGYYYNGRAEYLYTAAEMTGLFAGPITQLGFYFSANGGGALLPLNISVKNTTATALPASGFDEGGYTTVFSANFTPPLGWIDIPLTTPFIWDGTSNIIIQICYNNSDWLSTTRAYHTATATADYCRYYMGDTGPGCGQATYGTLAAKLNVRLTQPTGTLNGVVTSNATGNPLVGATVAAAGNLPSTTTIAGGAYTFTVAAGTSNFTASAPTYLSKTSSVNVPANGTATLNFALNPQPAYLTGHITNAANGAPVKGAKVVVNGITTYSLDGGLYNLDVFPTGSFPVTFTKAGFNDTTTAAITLTTGLTTTLNMALKEFPNTASQPFTAALNTGATVVNLSWGVPKGNYELIYDDGIQEFSTVWAAQNNLNAVKFTALNYPITIGGGKVYIGNAADYPAGTTPGSLSPFKMQVYDATGANGMPGAAVGSEVTVTPTTFGWNSFNMPNIAIASGNFYLVMKQVGAPPVAARLGVDTTANQLRSYSKFVSGGGQWLPAAGNFMIRAVVNGVGGPVDNNESVIGYQVYRLLQGQEGDQTTWTSLAAVTGTTATDPSWPSFTPQAYRWAVKAHYTGNRWSLPIFSNVLGKNWTAAVTVNVSLSCDSLAIAGSKVTLHNILFDSTYSVTLNTSHTATFPTVWKGKYELKVERYNFISYLHAPTTVYSDTAVDVILIQQKTPPTNMHVDGVSAIATWDKPVNDWIGINETWDSGNFTANGWIADEDTGGTLFGYQWQVYNGAAQFYWDLGVLNYNLSLTSRSFTPPQGSRLMHFSYDIMLDNLDADNLSGMKVEILDGTTWKLLKDYSCADGSFPYTHFDFDISAYASKTYKVRFHAYGDDAYRINEWDVDNIVITAKNEDITPCILAYNVYLTDQSTSNTILSGQTQVTHWQFPASQLKYGTTYKACVTALYGSGESVQTSNQCDVFTAKFLCAPTTLTGVPIETTAYLTWVAPNCMPGHIVDYILDQGMLTYGYSCSGAPVIEGLGNYFPIAAGTSGVIKSFDVYTFATATMTGAITYQMDMYNLSGVLMGTSAPFVPAGSVAGQAGWNTVVMPDVPFNGPFYGCFRYNITNPAWAGCALAVDTMYSIHHNNVAGYFEATPPAPWFWQLNTAGGGKKGAFVIRAKAFVYDRKKNLYADGDAPAGSISSKPLEPQVNDFVNPNTTMAPANVPPLQKGYTIWRDGVQIDYLSNNATLEYYDYNLPSGLYSYTVKAFYDVSPIAPGTDNSLPAGPVLVPINFGRALPFSEPWTNGTFTFNDWTVGGNNWSVNTGVGNPLPSADFSWQPVHTSGYSIPLTSPTLSATPYSCASIWLDFDYKLISQTNTSNEKLAIEVKLGGSWSTKLVLKNDKNYDWTTNHIKLSGAYGKAFQVRFRAFGADSRDILHWYVDNIKVYAVCTPPTTLTYTQSHNTVNLSWAAPVCPKDQAFSLIIDDGSWENGWRGVPGYPAWYGNLFQITGSNAYLTSFDVYFLSYGGSSAKNVTIDVFDLTGTLLGSTAPFLMPSSEFKTVPIGNTSIGGSFYAMVHWDATAAAAPYSHFLGQDTDGSYAADDLGVMYDGVAFQTMGNYQGSAGSFMLRAHGMKSGDKSSESITFIAGKSPLTGGTRGVASPDQSVGSGNGDSGLRMALGLTFDNQAATGTLTGYNVYRTDSTANVASYHKLNTNPVAGTTYTDVLPLTGLGSYKYYVTSSFNDTVTNAFLCESPKSNEITVQFPHVGIIEIGNGQILVYPNPATDNVNVKSDYVINSIEVMNYVGQTVYRNNTVNGKITNFSVSNLNAGIYFVKVSTEQGARTVKITVTR